MTRATHRALAPILGPLLLLGLAWAAWKSCTGSDEADARKAKASAEADAKSYRDGLVQAELERVKEAFSNSPPTTLEEASRLVGIPPTECGRGGRPRGGSSSSHYALWKLRAEVEAPDTRVYVDESAREGRGEFFAGNPIRLRVENCDQAAKILEVESLGSVK